MTQNAVQTPGTIAADGPKRWLAFVEAAQRFSTPASTTETYGTVIHRDRLLSLSTAATLGCAATLLGVFFPSVGLGFLAMIGLGIWIDERGGNSWIRGLTPKSIGRNVLLWPFGGEQLNDSRPIILICLESGRPQGRGSQTLLLYSAFSLFVAIMGTIVHAASPDLPLPTQRWGACLLAAGPLLALFLKRMERLNCGLRSSIRVAENLYERLESESIHTHRIVIALVDQNPRLGDGLNALLQTQHSRIHPQNTSVICWARGPDQLCHVQRPRIIGKTKQNPRMEAALLHLDLPVANDFTSSTVARHNGFSSVGLRGGQSPQDVGKQITKFVRALQHPGVAL